MIGKKERGKIIKDIESDPGVTNYFLGQKYNHSPHSINDIRKEHEVRKMEVEQEEEREELEQKELEQEPGVVDVDDLREMGTQMEYEKELAPTRAQIEHTKIKKHSERLAEEVEKKLDEDEGDLVRGKQLREIEEKRKIIADYQRDVIDKQFNPNYLQKGSHWYTQEMLDAYVVPRDKIIKELEGQISQMKREHPAELKQVKAQADNDGYLRGVSDGEQRGDVIVCYACGQPMSKSQLYIPCANCFNQGWPIQAR